MPSIFVQAKVIVEKTAALRVIESLPRPMRPIKEDPRSSELYKFLHKLLVNIDEFPQNYGEMYNGLTLKTAEGFWLEMFGYSVGITPKVGEPITVNYISTETTAVLVVDIADLFDLWQQHLGCLGSHANAGAEQENGGLPPLKATV